MANVLGLHFGHDASACVVKDGKLLVNISDERISRVKKNMVLSRKTINYVLNEANLTIEDIDHIALSSYDFDYDNVLELFVDGKKEEFISVFETDVKYSDGIAILFGSKKEIPVHFVAHHIAHAASAYYTSNFQNSIVLTIDASSPDSPICNSLISIGDGNKLYFEECPGTMIGQGYTVFTSNLGFGPPYLKAGSLMGLSAYGTINKDVIKNIDKYVIESYNQGDAFDYYHELFMSLSGEKIHNPKYWVNDPDTYDTPNNEKILNTKTGRDMAATIQYLFENSVMHTVKTKIIPYGIKNLCLAGGSFLNCNTNSNIKDLGFFDEIHIYPAAGDDGIAVGSALYVAHHILNEKRYNYSNSDIAYTGHKYKTSRLLNHKKVASMIADGKVIAWFMGSSENGPRALGHRSLLADPRDFNKRELLNFVVKNREWFRPFAPSVLEEEAGNWFDPGTPSPFMLFTQKVLKPKEVPAITHIDGTARIQTVSKDMDKDYYEVIKEFFKITGIPMIINTSLNGNGQPIVETEEEALDLFNNNDGIDVLVLNGKIYEK